MERFKLTASGGPYVKDEDIEQFGDIIELGIFLLDCTAIDEPINR